LSRRWLAGRAGGAASAYPLDPCSRGRLSAIIVHPARRPRAREARHSCLAAFSQRRSPNRTGGSRQFGNDEL